MSMDRRAEAKAKIQKLEELLKQKTDLVSKDINPDTYLRYIPKKITYNTDGTIGGCQWSPEYVTHPSTTFIYAIIISEFEKTEEYQNTLVQLSDLFYLERERIQHLLNSFLMDAYGEKHRGDVDTLINDLENKPSFWHITARLYGVFPEAQEMIISEGVVLRKVSKEDLTYEVPPFSFGFNRTVSLFPHSILEISFTSPNPAPVQQKVEKLTLVLSLFNGTCASFETYTMKPDSYGQFGGTLSKSTIPSQEPKRLIKESELTDLTAFVSYFEPRIPEGAIFGEPLDPLEIAIKRYLESIRENLPIEEKLTRAVMGLEALFLENETELRFRLALRVAQLLGYLNEDSLIVYNTVSEAYDFRSSHVHGSVLSPDQKGKANEVLKHLWRYLRKAILIWIVEDVSSEKKKRALLKQIDGALINDTQRHGFKLKIEAEKTFLKGAI